MQARDVCDTNPDPCPASALPWRSGSQLGPNERCFDGSACPTTDRPGMPGICMGSCERDEDCGFNEFCNVSSGQCARPCEAGECDTLLEQPQACQPLVADCRAECYAESDADRDTVADADHFCEAVYGEGTYCNLSWRSTRVAEGIIYKTYHDEGACVVLGCELSYPSDWTSCGRGDPACAPVSYDCPANAFCDDQPSPGAVARCRAGCLTKSDCGVGYDCKLGEEGIVYDVEACRALEDFDLRDFPSGQHGVCVLGFAVLKFIGPGGVG
ncbi:MAG: hypothetical protein HC923_11305 [Myxococcales bacterium]|nr:hypothetical protein [Myxococcales bacterium]